MQFVKWDRQNSVVVLGPQGGPGDGDDWYPLVEEAEVINPRTQSVVYEFIEDHQIVISTVSGSPDPTWDQARQDGYGSLAEQLDLLWHDIDNNTLDKSGQFYAFIKGVKDNNPKP